MDEPDVDPVLIDRSLRFIRRVNAFFGYTRATLGHIERFSRGWKAGEQLTLLDVATGSADIPCAIACWASAKGFDLRVIGLDRHGLTAGLARQQAQQHTASRAVEIIRGDAMSLPFEDRSVDYVITNMFLHHLDDEQVVQVLREMDRVARRGIIAADLLRHRRAWFWINLFTTFSNPMVRHDARVSVEQAFTREEVLSLSDRAQIDYTAYFEHFGHRFVLAGEKPRV